MWIPRQNVRSLAWPVKALDEIDWNALNLGDELNVDEKNVIPAVLKRFPDVIPTFLVQLGQCSFGKHKINIGDN